jgi:hypothetical protein
LIQRNRKNIFQGASVLPKRFFCLVSRQIRWLIAQKSYPLINRRKVGSIRGSSNLKPLSSSLAGFALQLARRVAFPISPKRILTAIEGILKKTGRLTTLANVFANVVNLTG